MSKDDLQAQAKQVAEYIKQAKKIVFFTGAGMSTGSGIPDFRSQGGIYDHAEEKGFNREEVLSINFLHRNPKDAYYFLGLFTFEDAFPNSGHKFIAELENKGKDVSVVTQNCDRLHQEAGSSKVYELHGNSVYWTNMNKRNQIPYSDVIWTDDGMAVNAQGQRMRPDIVLFGEGLDGKTVNKSVKAIEDADLLFVLGTSLAVYPAAMFIDYFGGDHVVLVNKSETMRSVRADVQIRDDIVKFFELVNEELNILQSADQVRYTLAKDIKVHISKFNLSLIKLRV